MPDSAHKNEDQQQGPDHPDTPTVSRCICFNAEFEDIKRIAEETGGGLAEAHRQTGCGARCGLCLPYIQLMLRTGQTTFPIMWAEDFKAHGINAGRVGQIQRALLQGRYVDPSPAPLPRKTR